MMNIHSMNKVDVFHPQDKRSSGQDLFGYGAEYHAILSMDQLLP
jgi:hypothetical protein